MSKPEAITGCRVFAQELRTADSAARAVMARVILSYCPTALLYRNEVRIPTLHIEAFFLASAQIQNDLQPGG